MPAVWAENPARRKYVCVFHRFPWTCLLDGGENRWVCIQNKFFYLLLYGNSPEKTMLSAYKFAFPGGGRDVTGQAARPSFCVAFLALAEAPGFRRGRRRLAGRGSGPPGRSPGRQTKERTRGQRPWVRSFRALRAQPPPPPVRWNFRRPCDPSTIPFLPRHPTNQPSPPLPMSGGPAHSAGSPEKFSSRFSPAFFKSGPGGVGGWQPPAWSPQRDPGAVPRHATRNRRQAFWKVASSSSAREHWWSSASFWAMRGR